MLKIGDDTYYGKVELNMRREDYQVSDETTTSHFDCTGCDNRHLFACRAKVLSSDTQCLCGFCFLRLVLAEDDDEVGGTGRYLGW